MNNDDIILDVKDLKVWFPTIQSSSLLGKKAYVKAVNGVNFSVKKGEVLGVVGESGCGKSTIGRAILNLDHKTDGEILWLGNSIDEKSIKNIRSDLQVIFQDPVASLNPRMTVFDIIAEPLITHRKNLSKADVKKEVLDIMDKVGLLPQMINRYPHEFSGGQAQRIGIARAMILKPKLVICDEAVSALDVSIQAQILNLLKDLQEEFELSLIFISHNLSVVHHISDRILVLYLGRVMEVAQTDDLVFDSKHPYTKALISAVPIADPNIDVSENMTILEGELPSPINPPSGCVFRTRCPIAKPECAEHNLEIKEVTKEHYSSCLFS